MFGGRYIYESRYCGTSSCSSSILRHERDNMKRTIALVLAFCLLFGLGGCTNNQNTAGNSTSNPEASGNLNESTLVGIESSLPDGMVYVTAQKRLNDRLWVGGIGQDGVLLGYIGVDGESGLFDFPESFEFIYSMCEVDGNIAVLCGSMPAAYTDANGTFIVNDHVKGVLALLMFSESGALLSQTPLEQIYGEMGMIFKLMLEADGFFLLQCQNMLLKIGSDGKELGRIVLQEDNALLTSICLSKGSLLASVRQPNGGDSQLYTIDIASFEIENTLNINERIVTGLGLDKKGRVLAITDKSLNYLDTTSGTMDVVLSWEDLYISQEFIWAEEIEDGYLFYARYVDKVFGARYQQNVPQRTELVMATDSQFGSAKALAEAFNKSQDQYHIRVLMYGNEGTPMDLLRTEISAGNGPDIFAFIQNDTLSEIKSSNLYVNLFEYLDKDEQCSRATILPSLLSAMTENEALYFLPYTFSISTFTAPESLVSSPGITLSEAEQILAKAGNDMSLLPQWVTKDVMLLWSSRFSLDSYFDREKGTCNFDSPGFIELLELCGKWTHSGSETAPDDKYLLNLEIMQGLLRLSGINANYNGDYCFAGFPTEAGNGSMFQLELKLGISQQSKNELGAWEFLRFALSEKGQESNIGPGFFASKSSFTKAIDTALKDGITIQDKKFELTQADAQKLWELVNDTTLLSGSDSAVLTIITEEAEAYFSGIRTAEEAAILVQNRIALYLSEQS